MSSVVPAARPYRVIFLKWRNKIGRTLDTFAVDVLAYTAADAVTQVETNQKGRTFTFDDGGKLSDTFQRVEKVEPSPNGLEFERHPHKVEGS